jgi:hypothetical protein
MSAIAQEIDKLEAALRKLEEQVLPMTRTTASAKARSELAPELAEEMSFVPTLPLSQENGTKRSPSAAGDSSFSEALSAAEVEAASAVLTPADSAAGEHEIARLVGVSFHGGSRLPGGTSGDDTIAGNDSAAGDEECSDNPLADLIRRAQSQSLAASRGGRPRALDERGKGQLLGLLAVGLSLRQAAAILGVSHTTLRRTLSANAELADEINAARARAALEPLACVIREAKRSWRAATWLLKYLDARLQARDLTADEWDREMDEEHEENAGPIRGT